MAAPEYQRYQSAATFQAELNQLIVREIEWEYPLLVTITGVKSSPDRRYVTVAVSVLPAQHAAGALRMLKRQAKYLAFKLGDILGLRFTPELRFEAASEGEPGADDHPEVAFHLH